MSRKKYRPWNREQAWLFPPAVDDLLPDDHLVFFVRDLLCELDLSPIEALIQAKDPRGERPYDPRLMLWILVYGYCRGIYSSRRLEQATWEDMAFRVICGDCHPHFTTINEFRRVHREAFSALFLGVLVLCQAAGMVSLGHVAIDGSRIKASASKHKASSYGRLTGAEKRLMAQVQELLDRSERADADEDSRFGAGRREWELPDELKHKQTRLARIKEARRRLEEQAATARAEDLRERARVQRERAATEEDSAERQRRLTRAAKSEEAADRLAPKGDDNDEPPTAMPSHRTASTPDGEPRPEQQTNFVDPDSRIMKDRDGGFIQAFNVQIAVDADHQVIVAEGVSNLAPDQKHLIPMHQRILTNLGEAPEVLTADAGYWSAGGVHAVEEAGSNALVAVSSGKKTERGRPIGIGPPPAALPPKGWMRWKLDMAPNRDTYKMRKATVEPVFGHIKQARGFRQFSFRGLPAVRAEWTLICLAHNMMKLFKHRNREAAPA